MNLADAVHALAITGSRLTAGLDGGITLVVPDGTTVPRQVLDVLRAHREQLAAVVEPAATAPVEPRRGDLAEYLAEKSITGSAAELVLHAARAFNVRTDRIKVEAEGPAAESAPTFFEPGVPCLTTIDTEWHEAGIGLVTVPAGTLAIVIPQTWAIADPHEQVGIEATLDSLRRHKKPLHVPVWLNGKARAIEHSLITFEGAVAPDGMNLLPWRPTPRRSPR
jgi:hypothetical protein